MKKLKLLSLLAALLLPMGLRAQETLTINDGTATNEYIPFYGLWVDTEGQCSEFIIPADDLTEMTGGTISKLTFYISSAAAAEWNSTHNVYLKEVEGTTLSTLSCGADATVVYSGVLNATGTTMEISFTEDFQYNGGNLLIGEIVTATGTYKSASFYGVGNLTTGVSAYRKGATGSYNSVNTESFLPKVTFEYTPGGGHICRRPSGLAVVASATTTTSLTFGWTAPEGVSEFVYAVDEDADWTLTSDNPLTIDDLAPSTLHTLRVRSYCGYGDTSAAVSASAYTACDVLTHNMLPYSPDFDQMSAGRLSDPCWSSTSTEYPSISSSYASATGGKSLQITSSYSSYPIITVALPQMDDLSDLMLTFNYLVTANKALTVGVMTDPSDATTFTALQSYTGTGINGATWAEAELPLNNETEATYVAFRVGDGSNSISAYIDDLTIDVQPACMRPTAISVTNITAETATLVITDPTEVGSYHVILTANGEEPIEEDIDETTYTLTVEPSKSYTVTVAANCGDGTTTATRAASFQTPCTSIALTDGAYNEGFENMQTGAANMSNCWDRFYWNTTSIVTNSHPYVMSTRAHDGSNALRMYSSYEYEDWYRDNEMPTTATATDGTLTSANYSYDEYFSAAFMPVFAEPLNGTTMSFWYKAKPNSSYTLNYMRLLVGVSETTGDTSTFTRLLAITPTDTNWHEYEVELANYTGSGNRITFIQKTSYNYGDDDYGYIDDIHIELLGDCTRPASVAAQDIEATTATITWYDANHTDNYRLVLNGDEEHAVEDITDTFYMAENLTPNTVYNVAVQTYCGDEWTDARTGSFRTACAPYDAPRTEDFENEEAGATPSCWTNLGGTTDVLANTTYSNNSHGGSKYIKFYGSLRNMIAMPAMADEISSLQVRFWTRPESFTNNNCGTFEVGYITDLTDTTTFTAVASYSYDAFSAYEEKEVSMAGAPEGAYIAFLQKANATNYFWYLDDVVVEPLAACPTPQNVSVSNIEQTSATITITDASEINNYHVKVFAGEDDTVFNEIITTAEQTIEDLSTSTKYTVSVAAVCGDTETSAIQVTFRTACGLIDELPFAEDFESYATGSTAEFNPCWVKGGQSYSLYVDGNSSNKYMYMYTSTSNPSVYLITPTFDESLPLNSMELTLKGRRYTSTYPSHLLVAAIDGDSYSATTEIDTLAEIDFTSTDWEDQEISFATYEGSKQRVIFLSSLPSDSYSGYVYLDDVNFHVLPACARPNAIAVSEVTESSISVTTTGSADATYRYYITPGAAADTDYFAGQGLSYTFEDLQEATTYTVGVMTECGDDYSADRNTTASTTLTPAALPYSTGFEEGDDVAWQMDNGVNISNGWYIGSAASNGGSNGLYVSNDNGTTNAYTTSGAPTVSYASKLFAFDEGEYTLSYDWKCNGEGSTTPWDYMRVFVVPATTALVANDGSDYNTSSNKPDGSIYASEPMNLSTEWQSVTATVTGC